MTCHLCGGAPTFEDRYGARWCWPCGLEREVWRLPDDWACGPGPLPASVVRAFLERCGRERLEAGGTLHVEDPEVLARIARTVAR